MKQIDGSYKIVSLKLYLWEQVNGPLPKDSARFVKGGAEVRHDPSKLCELDRDCVCCCPAHHRLVGGNTGKDQTKTHSPAVGAI